MNKKKNHHHHHLFMLLVLVDVGVHQSVDYLCQDALPAQTIERGARTLDLRAAPGISSGY
jgi:hypothetical protein